MYHQKSPVAGKWEGLRLNLGRASEKPGTNDISYRLLAFFWDGVAKNPGRTSTIPGTNDNCKAKNSVRIYKNWLKHVSTMCETCVLHWRSTLFDTWLTHG
jgi:hypothetical protein